MSKEYLHKGAVISQCHRYRYLLTRTWAEDKPMCAFIGLNPSTADADEDDPTIRRCVDFADRWGFGVLAMVNLFPYRATSPVDMKRRGLRNGIQWQNLSTIRTFVQASDLVITAWGTHGTTDNADHNVCLHLREHGLSDKLHHLGMTKGETPRHPLYIRKDTQPQKLDVNHYIIISKGR